MTLLSYAFWKRQFGADPDIVGKAVNFDGRSVTIICVLPETFDFGSVFSPGSKVDTYGPAILDDMEDWGNTLALIGRLKPEVSIGQAQAEADLAQAQANELLALVNVYQALGGGWQE